MEVGNVVRFTYKHEFYGCLGIITKKEFKCGDILYTVAIPIPNQETKYVAIFDSQNDLEFTGKGILNGVK